MTDDIPAQPAPKRAEKRPDAEAALVAQSRPSRLTVADLRALSMPPAWMHEAAATIHGWREHEAAFARPIRLTGEEYAAALEAAKRPNEFGEYAPHEPALSAAIQARRSK